MDAKLEYIYKGPYELFVEEDVQYTIGSPIMLTDERFGQLNRLFMIEPKPVEIEPEVEPEVEPVIEEAV